MSNDKHIRTYSASDIEKYHQGKLSPGEMHAMEKAALDDPFLAEAMEGYAASHLDIQKDLEELRSRLGEKTQQAKIVPIAVAHRRSYGWLRAAVAILFIAGAGLLAYQFLFNNKPQEIAQNPVGLPTADSIVSRTDTSQLFGSTVGDTDAAPVPSGESKSRSIDGNNPLTTTTTTVPAAQEPSPLKEGYQTEERKDVNAEIITVDRAKESPATEKLAKVGSTSGTQPDVKNQAGITADLEQANSEKKEDAALREQEIYSTNTRVASIKGRSNDPARRTRNNLFRGTVTDASNNPLPFANIRNTDDNVGTYTDARGNFTLVSPYDSVMNVQVSALGFENSRLQLRSDAPTHRVALSEDRSISARILDTVKRNFNRSRENSLSFEEPEPADGWLSYDAYLANNLHQVPEALDIKKNSGSDAVELSFEVNKNGDPVNIRVEKSLCKKCDEEAIRLVKEGPKWKRKAKKGKRTTVTVPFIKSE